MEMEQIQNIVTLCEDESLNVEIYDDDSLIVWLFSYENNIIRDNNEDACLV